MIREGRDLTWLDSVAEDPHDLAYDHKMDISGSVYLRMKELGLTQRELAERTKMDRSQISRILSGKQNLTIATLAKLETALDFRLDAGFAYHPAGANSGGTSVVIQDHDVLGCKTGNAWSNVQPVSKQTFLRLYEEAA